MGPAGASNGTTGMSNSGNTPAVAASLHTCFPKTRSPPNDVVDVQSLPKVKMRNAPSPLERVPSAIVWPSDVTICPVLRGQTFEPRSDFANAAQNA